MAERNGIAQAVGSIGMKAIVHCVGGNERKHTDGNLYFREFPALGEQGDRLDNHLEMVCLASHKIRRNPCLSK